MVDMVIHRHEMRATLSRLCQILTKTPLKEAAAAPEPAQVKETVTAAAAE
jgi:acetyl-CoA carboxylase carboxyl transferase subunit beta